jgi:hypothetical protein
MFLDRLPVIGPQMRQRALWHFVPEKQKNGGKRIGLSFDLDYQADTDALPGLIELLGDVGATATMFSIGKLVEQDPAPYRRAADAGHEMGNHTHTHPDNPVLCPDREWWDLSPSEMAAEIEQSQDVIESATGKRPVGFRAPHFKTNTQQAAVLKEAGFSYVSDDLASKTPRPTPHEAGGLTQLPLSPCPGHRHVQFCSYISIRRPSNPAKMAGIHDVPTWQELWSRLLAGSGGYVNVYFDPMDVMRDEETRTAFRAMLEEARGDGWAITSLDQLRAAA